MIRFGLLGCGRIAKRHSDLLGGNHIDAVRLVAVCDIRSRADTIASTFAVPAIYDIDDFLPRKDIDAVAVLTPRRPESTSSSKSRWRCGCRTPTT
jgi:predicted dehydrogenase